LNCFACGSPNLVSLHENIFAGVNIRYVAHTGTGTQIVRCSTCGFMSVQFVHPRVAARLYLDRSNQPDPEKDSVRSMLHEENCISQLTSWKEHLPTHCQRVLFLGAGRTIQARKHLSFAQEIFTCDLVPEINAAARTASGVMVLEPDGLKDPNLEETFDLVILSNALERLTFPRGQLSTCARLLKSRGTLMFEVPNMSYERVREGQYSPEELNYFTKASLYALIKNEGNFSVTAFDSGEEATILKNATGFWGKDDSPLATENRPVLRMVLNNERHQVDTTRPDIDPQDIGEHLLMLSFACMIHRLSYQSYSLEASANPKSLLPTSFDGH